MTSTCKQARKKSKRTSERVLQQPHSIHDDPTLGHGP
jgi:hypothetical protein